MTQLAGEGRRTRRPRAVLTETMLMHQILSYCHALGLFVWRQNTIGTYDPRRQAYRPSRMRGLPDLLGVIKAQQGRFLGLEVKTATGRVAPHQQMVLDELARHGAVAGVVRSLEDTRALLQRAGIDVSRVPL